MNRSRLKHILMESGLCIDRVRLLRWALADDRRRVAAFRYLRLRFSPAILESAVREADTTAEAGEFFSLAMAHVNVGDTYKTTGSDRTVLADDTLLRLAGEYDRPSLLEVGVSDGSSSLRLLREKAVFSRIRLTDRFSHFHVRPFPLGALFLDSEARLLGIKFLCFYLNLALEKRCDTDGTERIETANPQVAAEGQPVVEPFDMFTDVLDEPVELIKCANILNRSYFTETQLRMAVRNLGRSLADGGRLVVSHNNEKYAQSEAVLVLRRQAGEFVVEENINDHELAELFVSDKETA